MSKELADKLYEVVTQQWREDAYLVLERGTPEDDRYRECWFCDRGNMHGIDNYGEIKHQDDCLLVKVVKALESPGG